MTEPIENPPRTVRSGLEPVRGDGGRTLDEAERAHVRAFSPVIRLSAMGRVRRAVRTAAARRLERRARPGSPRGAPFRLVGTGYPKERQRRRHDAAERDLP